MFWNFLISFSMFCYWFIEISWFCKYILFSATSLKMLFLDFLGNFKYLLCIKLHLHMKKKLLLLASVATCVPSFPSFIVLATASSSILKGLGIVDSFMSFVIIIGWLCVFLLLGWCWLWVCYVEVYSLQSFFLKDLYGEEMLYFINGK